MGKVKIFDFLKTNGWNKTFCAEVVTTNGFALNLDKSLQIYFFCVKRQAKNNFLKVIESISYAQIYLSLDAVHINIFTSYIFDIFNKVICCILMQNLLL